jgi:hypothetical protein
MLYSKMTKEYYRKLAEYLSYWKDYNQCNFIVDKEQMPGYPELHGFQIRDLFDAACLSTNTQYGISDNNRCCREIQSVGTDSMFAQDHTMEVTKNYQRSVGAHAVWDVAIETGEIACAVVVGTVKVCDFAHAAESMCRRSNFNPLIMYSDTWPAKHGFWNLLFGNCFEGRLGLFHFEQRII